MRETAFPQDPDPLLGSILHPENGSEAAEPEFTLGPDALVNSKYTLSKKLWKYLRDYAAKHKAKGNGFGYSRFDRDGVEASLRSAGWIGAVGVIGTKYFGALLADVTEVSRRDKQRREFSVSARRRL